MKKQINESTQLRIKGEVHEKQTNKRDKQVKQKKKSSKRKKTKIKQKQKK